jgi:hypothetical protein
LPLGPLLNQLSKRAPNEQHDHSAPLLDLDKGGAGDMGGRAVMALAPWLVTSKCATSQSCRGSIMQSYSPELIQTMRAALDEVMTKIPLEQATPGIKAAMAECILKAAANGQTSYHGLIAAASEQIQTILSMLT